jgi:diacylglycerol kinase family enzyme
MAETSSPVIAQSRIGAMLNTASGSYRPGAEAELRAIVERAGGRLTKLWTGKGADVGSALKDAAGLDLDVLIVLGGDGTIRSAAASCSSTAAHLIPLPGGTMNRLPRALYGMVSWQEALAKTLAAPKSRAMDGGRIADEMFFVSAIIGNASLLAHAREAMRDGEIAEALREGLAALARALDGSLRYQFADQAGEAKAVYVCCPLEAPAAGAGFDAVALTPESVLGALRLALRVHGAKKAGADEPFSSGVGQVAVDDDEPIPAVLDGESIMLDRSATVEFSPAAFQALVPVA